MSSKLYVGNIPFASSEDEVRVLFESIGKVTSIKLLRDKQSGQLRGYGFIEMSSADVAKKAIETLHGNDFNGRRLIVTQALQQEDAPPRKR